MIGPTAHVETLVGSVVVRPGLARLGLGLTVKNKSIVPQFEVGLGLVLVKAVNQSCVLQRWQKLNVSAKYP